MSKGIKVVVTGGAGFIGSHLVDELIKQGYEVDVFDNLSSGKFNNINREAYLENGDVRNIGRMESLFDGVDYVFHTAALPRVQVSIKNPYLTNFVNITGTLNILDTAARAGVKRVIYSASSSVYGDQTTTPLRESMRPKLMSPYALQKHVGELYSKIYYDVYGLKTVSLRYFNVYGSRQDPKGEYACVIAKFLEQKRLGLPLTITGDGEQTRDFTHVHDVVRANLLAMESTKVGQGEVINIGAGVGVSINSLAEIIGGEVEYVEERLEPRHTCASIRKAKRLLGWKPEISFKDGIEELLRGSTSK